MSWKTALDTIDTRLRARLHAKNESLQHWKLIIENAYSDFQANFPGFRPDPFAGLVMSSDGRSGDSNFPNLVVPGERERYGL